MITDDLKILMLEDSDADTEMIQRLLKKNYTSCLFKVMMTKGAYEQALDEFKPDLILSDNDMPQFSASEALAILQQRLMHIPFILVTGTVSEEFAAGIIKAGADDYLLKDRLARLPAAIEAALKQKQTEREKMEAAERLQQSEEKYRSMMERVTDGFVALDKNWQYTYVNNQAAVILKSDPEQLIGKNIWAHFPESGEKPFYKAYHQAFDEQRYIHFEEYYPPFDFWLENHVYPSAEGVSVYFRDVTARKKAEEKILKANRLYLFISEINQMIVHTIDEVTLYKEICRIAVEQGQFRMAWIGMIDEPTKKVVPILHFGDEKGYLFKIKPISIDENVPEGRGPTGRALRQGKFIVCNDIENDPSMVPWKDAALGRGYRSSISIPVKKFGKIIGSLSVYASEKFFFDEAEIALLEEVAEDVSFALENFEKEALRKKAEQAVIKSEQRYHILTDVSPVGIFHTDASGYTTYVNPKWCQISGLSFQEAIGYGWVKAVHEDDKKELAKNWDTVTKAQGFSIAEYRFVRPDGTIVWVLGQATPEKNADNEVVGYVGTTTDITERKKAEESVIVNEKRFRKLVENGNDAFVILNTEGRPLYVSSSVERVLGYTEEEVYKMDMFSLVHPDNVQKVQQTNAIVMASPGVPITSHVSRLKHKDGTWHWYEDTITNLINDPDIGGIVDNFRDITERVNNQIALAQSEEKYREIVENITDILCTHDLEGKVLSVNATAKKCLGYEIEDMLKMKIQDVLLPYSKDRFGDYINSLKKYGFAKGLMYVQTSTGENRVWEFRNTLRTDDVKPPFVYGFAQDVTGRIRAEEAIKNKNAQLQTISDNLPGVMLYQLMGNPDGTRKFTYVSNGVIAITGETPEEILEDPSILYNVILEEDIPKMMAAEKESYLKMEVFNVEVRCRTPKGEIRWLNIISTPRKIDDGQIVWDGFHLDITERKKADEVLRESEETFSKIFYLNPSVCAINDLQNDKFIDVNEAFVKYFGFNKEEVIGKTSVELGIIMPAIRNEILSEMDEDGIIHNIETRLKTRNGEHKDVLLSTSNIYLHNKEYAYTVSNDITERKKAEEAVKKANERFELFAKATNDVIWDRDLLTGELWWNENYFGMFGNVRKSVPEDIATWRNIIHPEDRKKIVEGVESAINSGEYFWDDEYRCINNTGNEIFIYDRGFILRDEMGKPYRMIGSMLDFTERKKAEDAKKASDEQYRTLVEQASDGIFIADEAGKFVIVNSSGCKLSGYTTEELKELTIYNLVQPANLIANPFNFEEMHQPHGARSERKMLCKDGTELDVEISAKFLSDKRFIAFVRDITERIKAQNEILREKTLSDSIISNLPGIFYLYDKEGNFIRWNENFENVTGYNNSEIKKMHPVDFYDAATQKIISKRIETVFKGRVPGIEAPLFTKEKKKVPFYFNSMAIEYEGRHCLIGMGIDISEQKKAQDALKESEEKYRLLVEQASDAIFIADTNGRFVTVNSSACKLSQYTEEELMQMTIFDFAIAEDVEKRGYRFEELKQGKTTVTERVMAGKNGVQVHVEITAKLLSDGRLLAFVRDISERIKAQNEIIKEKNLSDSIINSLPASFFMINIQGKMLRWNRHLETASKYNTEEINNMHPFDFFDKADKELLSQKVANVFFKGEDNMEATVCLKTREKVPYYFKGISIEYNGESCIMGVGIDISERVKAQEEIKETNEKLRDLTAHLLKIREEERKRIGREIHDELGQQLTAIKMDVSWIDKKTLEENALIKRKLKNVITLLDGSNQSIRRILSELRPGILDDNGLLEALEWLNKQFTIQTGIPVEFKTGETELRLPEPVSTCIFRVYQEAFTNITRYAQANKITTSLEITDGKITVTIEDNGEGFDTIGVQNKKSFGILGMKERILSLNGNFQLVSVPGKGTKITIVLPLAD